MAKSMGGLPGFSILVWPRTSAGASTFDTSSSMTSNTALGSSAMRSRKLAEPVTFAVWVAQLASDKARHRMRNRFMRAAYSVGGTRAGQSSGGCAVRSLSMGSFAFLANMFDEIDLLDG